MIGISPASAQRTGRDGSSASDGNATYVVVGRIEGIRRSRRHLLKFQRALGKDPGLRVTSTRVFAEQAKGLRVEHVLPEDARGLERICELLELDAVIYVRNEAKGRDSNLVITVYAGDDGRFAGEQSIQVPNGRLSSDVWRLAAQAISGDLRRISTAEAISNRGRPTRRTTPRVLERPTRPRVLPRRARPAPQVVNAPTRESRNRDLTRRIDNIPIGDVGDAPRRRPKKYRLPLVEFNVGAMTLARNFLYTASPSSQVFTEGGIDYNLGLVPGFAIEAQLAPFAGQPGGIRGLGFRLLYEKAFFRTQQTVTKDDGSETTALLESNHSHFLGEITYRHLFKSKAEIGGYLGGGNLTFQLAANEEYQGASYNYLSLGMQGFIPLGTKYIGFDGRAGILPYASLGDMVQELGKEATIFGFRVYTGLASRLDSGLTLSAGVEYTSFQSGISGEGRGGRVGQSASDGFIALRFLGGYRF